MGNTFNRCKAKDEVAYSTIETDSPPANAITAVEPKTKSPPTKMQAANGSSHRLVRNPSLSVDTLVGGGPTSKSAHRRYTTLPNALDDCAVIPHTRLTSEPSHRINLSRTQIVLINNLWEAAKRRGTDEPGYSIIKTIMLKAPEVDQIFNFVNEHSLCPNDSTDKNQQNGESLEAASQDRRLSHGVVFPPPSAPPALLQVHPRPRRGSGSNMSVRSHGRRFTDTLDKLVKSLLETSENRLSLCPANQYNGGTKQAKKAKTHADVYGFLIQLGRMHADHKGAGFSPKLWDIFGEVMIQKSLEWGTKAQRSKTTQEAWSEIILYIIGTMKDGYYLELRRRRSADLSLQGNSSH